MKPTPETQILVLSAAAQTYREGILAAFQNGEETAIKILREKLALGDEMVLTLGRENLFIKVD